MSTDDWEYRIRMLRMRPRFRLQIEEPPDLVMERLREALEAGECPCRGKFYTHQVELMVPPEDEHTWSPHLNVVLYDRDGTTEIDGRFGPKVSIWSMFVAAYAVVGITGTVGLVIGTSQMSLGMAPSGLWLALLCLILVFAIYGVAMIGQGLAMPQMWTIRRFVTDAVNRSDEARSRRTS